MSKRVLITGGAGFIAHHTIKYYLKYGLGDVSFVDWLLWKFK